MVPSIVASVVVPTHNRVEILRECVGALSVQKHAPVEWELVVVDDGSTDGTWRFLQEASRSAPMPLRAIRNPGRGPASARNAGLVAARGEIVLLIGDDILVGPDWLERHVAAHWESGPKVAVLGFTDWDPRMQRTYLADYLDRGIQFGYERIADPDDAGYAFFYTSNISLKRRFMVDAGEWFDESYVGAAMEDIDLGYRLERRGLKIRYVREAAARHFHPIDWPGFLKRARCIGDATAVFHERFPELTGRRWLGRSRHHQLEVWSCRALRPLAERLRWRSAAERCYRVCFDYERARGYRARAAAP